MRYTRGMNANLSRGLIFLGGIVVGALGATLYLAPDSLAPTPVVPSEGTTSSATPFASGDVAVSDQAAGKSVLVDSVTVPPPGVWVAVEEVNQDGSLGKVLGAAKVGGPRSNVEVSLLRSTNAGMKYAVVLYRDDGDGTFELGQDSVYVDFDTGQPVEELFNTK